MLAKDMRSTFYLRVFRKHLGMYLCGFGAEWLFASIFTYFVIFVLQHDPAMVAGLNSLNSILQLLSTALFIGLCVKKGFSKPYILALSIVIFSVLLYTSLWFFHLPPSGDHPDVRHHGAVRPGYRRRVLHSLDRLHLPRRCR
jgi:oligogalacturonide transporter